MIACATVRSHDPIANSQRTSKKATRRHNPARQPGLLGRQRTHEHAINAPACRSSAGMARTTKGQGRDKRDQAKHSTYCG